LCCCSRAHSAENTLPSLHDALPILEMQQQFSLANTRAEIDDQTQTLRRVHVEVDVVDGDTRTARFCGVHRHIGRAQQFMAVGAVDRKSTRLNSSHVKISYAVFCLKK